MSQYETVLYSSASRVADIRMNRPAALNCFNTAMRSELAAALREAAADDNIRVIILSGEGRGFGAGADLKEGIAASVTDQLNYEYRPVFDAIAQTPKPVISAIGGAAAGISLSVGLFCDLTIMADNAFLLSPFTTIGLLPDGGQHWLLGRQIGYKRAYQMIVEAERVPAQVALDWGLVNKVVPAAELMSQARAWAETLATRPPLSLGAIKATLREAMSSSFDETYSAEAVRQQTCLDSEDCKEGVDAFMNKRTAVFTGK